MVNSVSFGDPSHISSANNNYLKKLGAEERLNGSSTKGVQSPDLKDLGQIYTKFKLAPEFIEPKAPGNDLIDTIDAGLGNNFL